jgi:hypothetical protein
MPPRRARLAVTIKLTTTYCDTAYSGSFVQVGMGAPNVELPLYLIVGKEIAFHGSFRYVPSSESRRSPETKESAK